MDALGIGGSAAPRGFGRSAPDAGRIIAAGRRFEPVGLVFERRTVTTTSLPSRQIGPAQAGDLAARRARAGRR